MNWSVGATLLAVVAVSGAADARQLAFSDQTEAAGIAVTHTCPEGMSVLCEQYGGGAVGDFDRDGFMDLFVLAGGLRPDRLYINQGDGTFAERSAEWGVDVRHVGGGAAVGDFDGDGFADIFVSSLGPPEAPGPGQHILYRNVGGRAFTNVAEAAGVHQTSPTLADGFGAAFGDYDLDGDLDLCTAAWLDFPIASHGNRLFRNDGNGRFTDVTGTAITIPPTTKGFTPTFADMDGDRYPELLLVGDFGTSRYFVNDREGGFVDATESSGTGLDANGMGSAVADLTGDGLLDWYVTSIYDPMSHSGFVGDGNKLYVNQGNHRFLELAETAGVDDGGWGWGTVAVDVDNDGLVDLVETNGFPSLGFAGPAFVWLNGGDLSFRDVAVPTGFRDASDGRGLLHLDYDLDGDQDFVVFPNQGAPRLFRNDLSGPGAAWLRVSLDTDMRPDLAPGGLGSRLVARIGARELVRTHDGGSHYLTTSEPAVHFGLGSISVVDELEILWPDGTRTVLEGLAVNQHLTVLAR